MPIRYRFINISTCISLMLFSLPSSAQWWNPLAPKDYNECIIKNMKEGMSKEAVRALTSACIQKYPGPKKSAAAIKNADQINERYKKCRLDRYHSKQHFFLGLGSKNSHKTTQIINNMKNFKYDGHSNTASFQNMNGFGISGVGIGLTNAAQCHTETEDYAYSTYCVNYSGTEQGVAPTSFGTLNCLSLPNEAKSMGFCKIGYSPTYYKFNENLLEFLEENGYCN